MKFSLCQKGLNLIMVSVLLFTFTSFAFSKPNTKYLDYPIEYTQTSGVFEGKPTPRMLFYTANNLLNITNSEGAILICKIDKKSQENNTVSYYLSLNQGKKKLLIYQITLKINDDDECNYMTYFKLKNVATGMITEFSYDADDSVTSFGRIMGGFIGTASYMFNVAEINKSFEKQVEESSSSNN